MIEERTELRCPSCGCTDLYLCSRGAWNCPECFHFVRMATEKEIEKYRLPPPLFRKSK